MKQEQNKLRIAFEMQLVGKAAKRAVATMLIAMLGYGGNMAFDRTLDKAEVVQVQKKPQPKKPTKPKAKKHKVKQKC